MAAHRKAPTVIVSLTLVAIWTVWWAWRMWPDSGVSWHFSVDGANLLLHGSGLNIYADAPWLQTGPLSLMVAALLSPLPANVAKNVALVARPRLRVTPSTRSEFSCRSHRNRQRAAAMIRLWALSMGFGGEVPPWLSNGEIHGS